MHLSRRGLIGAITCAPAIVRASSPPIPDRVRVNDPRFSRWNQLQVSLDGVPQEFVLEFCRSEGWIEQHYSVNGRLARHGAAYALRRVHGRVNVRYI